MEKEERFNYDRNYPGRKLGRYTRKKWFAKEYQTNWIAEQLYLSNCGIRYEFVKNINGITTYKYRKTAKLFECLANFYKKHGIIE